MLVILRTVVIAAILDFLACGSRRVAFEPDKREQVSAPAERENASEAVGRDAAEAAEHEETYESAAQEASEDTQAFDDLAAGGSDALVERDIGPLPWDVIDPHPLDRPPPREVDLDGGVDSVEFGLAGIYGKDNRHDITKYATGDPIRKNARLVGAMFVNDDNNITPITRPDGSKGVQLTLKTLKDRYDAPLCDKSIGQPSRNEAASRKDGNPYVGPECTAVAVAPQAVLTAAHCLRSEITKLVFVFGYESDLMQQVKPAPRSSRPVVEVPAYSVFYAKCVIEQGRHNSFDPQDDWALIKLTERLPIATELFGSTSVPASQLDQQNVYMIGHPLGLPLMVADDARVLRVDNGWLEANLDAFGGNSGSPVFLDGDHKLVGILTQGSPDQRPREHPARDPECWPYRVVKENVTKEIVVQISAFERAILVGDCN